MKYLQLLVFAFLMTLSFSASAEWTKSATFEYSSRTSLKILGPANAKVKVTIGNEVKEETLPAVFNLPDADAFVPVRVIAADGDVWEEKVEAKAHKQAVLQLTYTPKPGSAPAPAPSTSKFIGRFENATDTCSPKARVDKFVAMRDGKVVFETTLLPNKAQHNIELLAGTYTVRIFRAGIFVKSIDFTVAKDGWVFNYGCRN